MDLLSKVDPYIQIVFAGNVIRTDEHENENQTYFDEYI